MVEQTSQVALAFRQKERVKPDGEIIISIMGFGRILNLGKLRERYIIYQAKGYCVGELLPILSR